ncbi:MAG: hypothetical protein IJI66_17105 [Erysipelotrichaceae bacterium]|nr:hypothetical protein [Erysipelotrichaceae bacterium]
MAKGFGDLLIDVREEARKKALKEISKKHLEELSNYFESKGLKRNESEEKAREILTLV